MIIIINKLQIHGKRFCENCVTGSNLGDRAEGSPQINASSEPSPRPFGERVRVRGTYGGSGHSVHVMFLATL